MLVLRWFGGLAMRAVTREALGGAGAACWGFIGGQHLGFFLRLYSLCILGFLVLGTVFLSLQVLLSWWGSGIRVVIKPLLLLINFFCINEFAVNGKEVDLEGLPILPDVFVGTIVGLESDKCSYYDVLLLEVRQAKRLFLIPPPSPRPCRVGFRLRINELVFGTSASYVLTLTTHYFVHRTVHA
ncbi:hypothetical protein Pyn_29401 [Prunus yedoensis var. nudiflora]|uniref:Uncharacterized protein n=1 Tax=Prunus yedoensis var. nudiflora TaxID=2094558 RepID=A0A314XUN1_PRUYE|nr:hypothetical protein Pyn_29401 [Prunus yedoensis var. nudiflora]